MEYSDSKPGYYRSAKPENLLFENAERYEQHEHLHLNYSLRSHVALKYYAFVNALLDNDIENA